MAAGATQAQKTRHAYNALHSIQRELATAGVTTQYCKANRVESAHLVHVETTAHVDGGFNIKFTWGNMSNGGSVGYPVIYFVHNDVTQTFGFSDYEKGIAKIVEAFAAPKQEAAPHIQGTCKDCGNGTLNNELNPAFRTEYAQCGTIEEEDSELVVTCLQCGSEHVDIL